MNFTIFLRQLLQEKQQIPFVDFMQLALYHPHYGYYTSNLPKLGKTGDFITAPELTPLFAQTLANQCQQVLSELQSPVVLEFGAGTGRLCVDLLRQLETLNALPQTYFILEVSGHLRHQQKEYCAEQIPHLLPRLQWISEWPSDTFEGIILANEILDAMPVHRFLKTTTQLHESYISLDTKEEFIETFQPCVNQTLCAYIKNSLPSLAAPYQSEVNLFIEPWIKQCSTLLKKGLILLIDYGFPRHEYYHPDRKAGTLMCHYQHQAHTNPLLNIGEQDISAHVDFTHIAEAAVLSGLQVAGYTNQASFLLANGLLSLFESIEEETLRFKTLQAVRQLTDPSEMGELFKVIALTKDIHYPLQGFQLIDKRASL